MSLKDRYSLFQFKSEIFGTRISDKTDKKPTIHNQLNNVITSEQIELCIARASGTLSLSLSRFRIECESAWATDRAHAHFGSECNNHSREQQCLQQGNVSKDREKHLDIKTKIKTNYFSFSFLNCFHFVRVVRFCIICLKPNARTICVCVCERARDTCDRWPWH